MKQIAPLSVNEIVRIAVKNMLINHVDDCSALSNAVQLEAMKKRMMRGEVVRFAYLKINGDVRIAVGTLQEQAVKSNVNGGGVPKKYYGQFAYLDLEKMKWRSFCEENFIGTIES